ncbi:hypothetical protein GYMLUDRAFT_98287 [Collybiopsis luxurians FD-317 M1]|uniref:Unplaced genomic scaffold GYMLUscaffold_39, whole genome shotgun sequence n=1 Tax=Collybiopsis luxurians FD-317 M1 TaxID=944289 RepID=A0A0D0CIF1_9AGAR|nr:hypothetical protein GYMLUDRAFT_98287 [Collybiopsis luxurians FD-317 M1]
MWIMEGFYVTLAFFPFLTCQVMLQASRHSSHSTNSIPLTPSARLESPFLVPYFSRPCQSSLNLSSYVIFDLFDEYPCSSFSSFCLRPML